MSIILQHNPLPITQQTKIFYNILNEKINLGEEHFFARMRCKTLLMKGHHPLAGHQVSSIWRSQDKFSGGYSFWYVAAACQQFTMGRPHSLCTESPGTSKGPAVCVLCLFQLCQPASLNVGLPATALASFSKQRNCSWIIKILLTRAFSTGHRCRANLEGSGISSKLLTAAPASLSTTLQRSIYVIFKNAQMSYQSPPALSSLLWCYSSSKTLASAFQRHASALRLWSLYESTKSITIIFIFGNKHGFSCNP